MTELLDLLRICGAATAHGLWLPLALWTLFALPLFLALRLWKGAHPLMQYGAHLALLLALPAGLLLSALVEVSSLWGSSPALLTYSLEGLAPLTVEATHPHAAAAPWMLFHTLGLAAVVAALCALVQGIRLFADARSLSRFYRSLSDEPPGIAREDVERLASFLGLRRRVRVVLTRRPVVPMTFGWRRPVVVLPVELAADRLRLRMALAHELVHVRRHDYAVQWAERVIAALFWVHPLVSALRRSLTRYRELSCDAAVLAQPAFDRRAYADLLLSFARLDPGRLQFTLGMTETYRHLKERVLAMKSSTHINRFTHPRLASVLLAGFILLSAATVIVSCSDLVGVTQDGPTEEPTDTFVIVEEMPELVGGLAAFQQHLHYPELAKKAGVEGRVIVQFIVGEEGNVVDPVIVRGVGSGLDEAALDALQKVEFKPGKQDGEPVKVKMSLPITFKLPQKSGTAPEEDSGQGQIRDEAQPPKRGLAPDVNEMPQLVGGLSAVVRQVRYPEVAKAAGVEGRVVVQFVVDEGGNVRDAEVLSGVGSGLDEEALRVARELKFTPAQKDGKPVPIELTFPFTFKLPQE